MCCYRVICFKVIDFYFNAFFVWNAQTENLIGRSCELVSLSDCVISRTSNRFGWNFIWSYIIKFLGEEFILLCIVFVILMFLWCVVLSFYFSSSLFLVVYFSRINVLFPPVLVCNCLSVVKPSVGGRNYYYYYYYYYYFHIRHSLLNYHFNVVIIVISKW
jgi:hypothetical protein